MTSSCIICTVHCKTLRSWTAFQQVWTVNWGIFLTQTVVVSTELHIVKSKGNVALINRGLCIFLAILKSNSNYRKKNFWKNTFIKFSWFHCSRRPNPLWLANFCLLRTSLCLFLLFDAIWWTQTYFTIE